jgi:hypothetical protein
MMVGPYREERADLPGIRFCRATPLSTHRKRLRHRGMGNNMRRWVVKVRALFAQDFAKFYTICQKSLWIITGDRGIIPLSGVLGVKEPHQTASLPEGFYSRIPLPRKGGRRRRTGWLNSPPMEGNS